LRHDWRAILKGWRIILLLSLLGISAFNTILYYSTHTTGATNIALIQTAMPLFVVLLSYLLFSQSITRGTLFGVVFGISGAAIVILKGQLTSLSSMQFSSGDLSMIFATFLYALYSVLLPKSPKLHPLSFLTVTFILGSLMLLPFYIWERHVMPSIAYTPQIALSVLYVALFPSVLAYLFWNHGVAVIGANTTGLFACLIPVFTPMIASVFLHEVLHLYHAIGLAMIIMGVITVHIARSHTRAVEIVPTNESDKP
jgi:drug/metabolite transporter (DMT)-like permease